MVIVVPIYEEHMTGVYYNTAAVIDADGSYMGKYRKVHIPQVDPGFYEKFFFKPGDLGYPVFETAYLKLGVYICYDRHFPEGWRALALNGAEYIVNPSATVAGLSKYLWELEQPASAAANGCFHRCDQSHRHRGAMGQQSQHGRILWFELHRRIRAARSKRRRATATTSCSCTKSISTWCARSAIRGSSSAIVARKATAHSPINKNKG